MPVNADEIWNRARDTSFEPVRAGDCALAAGIGFDGLIMSGGLSHSLEVEIPIVRYSTLTGVSCPSPSFCVAVDNAGRVTVGQAHEFRSDHRRTRQRRSGGRVQCQAQSEP